MRDGPQPPVLFVAWTRTVGRSREIAAALDGVAFQIHPALLAGRKWFLLRYLYNLIRTFATLIRVNPAAVIVTNPPLVAAVVVWVWSALTGRPFVLDSHPSAFGAKNHAISQRLIGVHRWLAQRAATTMVTTSHWVAVLESWGANGTIVHEAPPLWSTSTLSDAPSGRVFFPGVFAGDEPVDEVVTLARLCPELQVRVTGDLSKCPDHLLANPPGNLTLLGYLDQADFAAEVDAADVVLALTTEPTSVMRAAYEAVYSSRPLVVSDWPAGREAFPHAVHTDNDARSLATAVDSAMGPGRNPALLELALKEQTNRWSQQLHSLRLALSRTSRSQISSPKRIRR